MKDSKQLANLSVKTLNISVKMFNERKSMFNCEKPYQTFGRRCRLRNFNMLSSGCTSSSLHIRRSVGNNSDVVMIAELLKKRNHLASMILQMVC